MSHTHYPKTDADVSTLIGKVIKFNRNVEKCEIDFDRGMKARVTGFSITDPGEVFKLNLDFSEFKEENERLMQANYYDKTGTPTLKWNETKFYPHDCKSNDYFGYTGEGSDCFDVVEG